MAAASAVEPWDRTLAADRLRIPGPEDDKYRRGVLGVRTGSNAYPGAAVLGVSAAWRTGAGLLRYVPPLDDGETAFGLPSPAAAVLAARPETVFGDAAGRACDAWLIGSGTDPGTRSFADTAALERILDGSAPVVVDAGALGLALREPRPAASAPAILTPHFGEFTRLWNDAGLGVLRPADARADAASRLAAALGATVLLKGSTTVCASPGGRVLVAERATPWLASAGTGDVLAGVLGALVAAHATAVREDPETLVALGASAAVLHDLAARIAADDPEATGDGHPIAALDVVAALPAAFAALRGGTANAQGLRAG